MSTPVTPRPETATVPAALPDWIPSPLYRPTVECLDEWGTSWHGSTAALGPFMAGGAPGTGSVEGRSETRMSAPS
jgi:hypothetical protein